MYRFTGGVQLQTHRGSIVIDPQGEYRYRPTGGVQVQTHRGVQVQTHRGSIGIDPKGEYRYRPTRGVQVQIHKGSIGIDPQGDYRCRPTLSLTWALEWVWVVNATPRPLYSRERLVINCTGDRIGSRAGRDGCGKSHPHRDSNPGPSSLQRVAIPTELRRPRKLLQINKGKLCSTLGIFCHLKPHPHD